MSVEELYINVNLTWSCKKSCEYPSISHHLRNVFGNKSEYMINILYIKNHLLWPSESYQTRKSLFLFVVDFFCYKLNFFVVFFLSSFMSNVIFTFCFVVKYRSHLRQKKFPKMNSHETVYLLNAVNDLRQHTVSCSVHPQVKLLVANCPSVWLYNTNPFHVDLSVACALITNIPRSVKT